MPARKKASHRTQKRSRPKQGAKSRRKTSSRPSRKPQVPRRLRKAEHSGENTFVYECTRTGCGYKIWLDEKSETGSLRFDLKCPKCHNRTFKCLGKEDVPESFNMTEPVLNLDNIQPEALGSNSTGPI